MTAPRSPSCTCSAEFLAMISAHGLDPHAHVIGCPLAIARPYPEPPPAEWSTVSIGGLTIPPVTQVGQGIAIRPILDPIVVTVEIRR